ncbi:7-cyano-7-deazaguanine synthase QueC [PVC group bacterium (ex Bugula neritina AB1)]|nr:7-cyano-7-deazaguanine synthase QueC [PVC group bacterium (ex Bugula neritina AB1)]
MLKKAIILYSGGLDSSTLLALLHYRGYEIYTLTFDYGQKHSVELEKSTLLSKDYSVKDSKVITIDLRSFGGSSLTSNVPVNKHLSENFTTNEIPLTYVPARNILFLSYALAWGEVNEVYDIFIGVSQIDYSGYPDCRKNFIDSFVKMANLGTKAGVSGRSFNVHTPFIYLSKSEIITLGTFLDLNYGKTHSCYDPSSDGNACGFCESCLLRKKGFKEAEVEDPTKYTENLL